MHESHNPFSFTRVALAKRIPICCLKFALVAGTLLGLFAAPYAGAAEHFVTITSLYAFDPDSLAIEVGDTVTWYNQDEDDHEVVSDTGAWAPFVVLSGESASLVFNRPGAFPYRDPFWAPLGMTGNITVTLVRPPTISAPLRPNPSEFEFTISGTAGQTYIIETSDDLIRWVAIDTNVAPDNIFNYTNTSATNLTQFYRVNRAP